MSMATIRERRPGVWEVPVSRAGTRPAGRPVQTSRTVRGTKRDAMRLAASFDSRSAMRSGARTVSDILNAWVQGGGAAMAEVGIEISGEFPEPWADEIVRAADAVATMGCGDACPVFPGKRYEDWDLDDPTGKTVDEVRPIRDDSPPGQGVARGPRGRHLSVADPTRASVPGGKA
jgi:hypothetical protein